MLALAHTMSGVLMVTTSWCKSDFLSGVFMTKGWENGLAIGSFWTIDDLRPPCICILSLLLRSEVSCIRAISFHFLQHLKFRYAHSIINWLWFWNNFDIQACMCTEVFLLPYFWSFSMWSSFFDSRDHLMPELTAAGHASAHVFMASIYNITIKCGWLCLRISWGDNMKRFWQAGAEIYNPTIPKQ